MILLVNVGYILILPDIIIFLVAAQEIDPERESDLQGGIAKITHRVHNFAKLLLWTILL